MEIPARWASIGVAKLTGSIVVAELAGVRLVDPGQHLDEGGFAGAVLADQGVHLALAQRERDVVQRTYAREHLCDVDDF